MIRHEQELHDFLTSRMTESDVYEVQDYIDRLLGESEEQEYTRGYDDGYDDGLSQGREEGYDEARSRLDSLF